MSERQSAAGPSATDAVGAQRWAAALVTLHVALALLVFEPSLFPGADAGHYMVLGQALREGLGFRDIHLPGMPLHAKYPPGYPLLLAVAGNFGGLQVFKVVSLACTAAAVWLAYRVGSTVVGPRVSLGAAAVLAVAPLLLDFSHRVLSEAPFTLLVLLTVGLTRYEARWGTAALAAAALAFFTRTAGLALLVALALHAALGRDKRRTLVAVLGGLSCVVAWGLYQQMARPAEPAYLQQLFMLNPYDPTAGMAGPSDLVARVARNFWRYLSSELPGSFGLATVRGGAPPLTAVAGVVMGSLAVAGWLWSATRRLTIGHLVLLVYVGLILLWPPIWTDRRLLLPVLPLIVIFAGAAGAGLARRFGARIGFGAVGLVSAGLMVASLATSARVVPDRLACQAAYRSGNPCDLPEYAEFYALARWARDNTPPEAIIANRSPATFFLFSGRRGDLYAYSRDPAVVLHGLEDMGADYVVVDRLSATTEMYLVPAVAALFDRFQVVHVVGGRLGTILLRVLPAPRTAQRAGPR